MGSIDPRLPKSWNNIVVEEWQTLIRFITGKTHIVVNGSSLSVASIVATSRYVNWSNQGHLNRLMIHVSYGMTASLGTNPKIRNRINDSVSFIDEHLAQGHSVYGTPSKFSHSIHYSC